MQEINWKKVESDYEVVISPVDFFFDADLAQTDESVKQARAEFRVK